MDKKTKIHEDIMSFLDSYLKDTPRDIIKKEIAEISKIDFVGTSAKDYFKNFNSYYANFEEKTDNTKPLVTKKGNPLRTVGNKKVLV